MSPLRSSRARFLIDIATVACAVTFATASGGAQARRDSAASAQLPPGMPMDTAQARRWAELFTYLLTEFKDDHRDPVARLAGDFSSREIRLADDTSDGERWVAMKLTERELATLDLRNLAKRLYSVYAGR